MAHRRAVAASIAAVVLFSSMLISNLVLFSGAADEFRLVSLSTEESSLAVQATTLRDASILRLIDGAQELLSSNPFNCSTALASVGAAVSSEAVRLSEGTLRVNSTLAIAPDGTSFDDLAELQPFNGSLTGSTDLVASTLVQGKAPDGSVSYHLSESHLLNIPLRLGSLTERCIEARNEVLTSLLGMGGQLCNSTSLALVMVPLAAQISDSAAEDGFNVSVYYLVTSTQPCTVAYRVSAQQGVEGPEGLFVFTEYESGYEIE